jgi:hypothetical protein
MVILYIAPASGETHHPQCRIYRKDSIDWPRGASVRSDFQQNPDDWKECGLMNYQGRLVAFDGPDEQRSELVDCQPLAAGLTFLFSQA